jgi:hypothetical protein
MQNDGIVAQVCIVRMLNPFGGSPMHFYMAMKCDSPDDEGSVLKVRAFKGIVMAYLQDLKLFASCGEEVFAVEVLVFPYQL